jgi:hypothetical protein
MIRQLRGLTSKPINVNFFCHVPADVTSGQEQAWRDRLSHFLPRAWRRSAGIIVSHRSSGIWQ